MAIFKCKMCGGDLEIAEGASVAVCQYCCSKQTLPRFDSERKANLYDRANHLRRNNEFDKAEGLYEDILIEDKTDAEAYWSLVLCRYGIEYVEDPATHRRLPTVHRAQYTSVYADENYKKAVECADALQRSIYEEEAAAIDSVQKGILEISKKEEPFDIFICYKETDDQGKRTVDSVLAYDLYTALTEEGYKVFFSRVTLEDKLGTAYEPYIFAALHSAKVMIVLGTKREHFNAVWVKNEWSRYLALIRAGEKKTLVPVYRDMDPYDLPEEFSHLQAQDMGKLGAMQDIIRGLKKLTKKDEPRTAPAGIYGNATGLERLLLNAETYMKLKETEKAEKCYSDAVRDYPEDYRGWWGQITCSALHLPECSGDRDKLDTRMKQISQWFEHVRQLCPKEEYPKLEKQYMEYLHEAAVLDAGIKRLEIEQNIIEKQHASLKLAQDNIRSARAIIDVNAPLVNAGMTQEDNAQLAEFARAISDEGAEKNKRAVLNTVFLILGLFTGYVWFEVVYGIITTTSGSEWIGAVPLLLIIAVFIAIPIFFFTRIKVNHSKQTYKSLLKHRDDYLKQIAEKTEERKEKIAAQEALIAQESERMKQINNAIPEVERYLKERREDFIRFYYSVRCKEIGVVIPAPMSIEVPMELRVGC